jgi:hypothetical protein
VFESSTPGALQRVLENLQQIQQQLSGSSLSSANNTGLAPAGLLGSVQAVLDGKAGTRTKAARVSSLVVADVNSLLSKTLAACDCIDGLVQKALDSVSTPDLGLLPPGSLNLQQALALLLVGLELALASRQLLQASAAGNQPSKWSLLGLVKAAAHQGLGIIAQALHNACVVQQQCHKLLVTLEPLSDSMQQVAALCSALRAPQLDTLLREQQRAISEVEERLLAQVRLLALPGPADAVALPYERVLAHLQRRARRFMGLAEQQGGSEGTAAAAAANDGRALANMLGALVEGFCSPDTLLAQLPCFRGWEGVPAAPEEGAAGAAAADEEPAIISLLTPLEEFVFWGHGRAGECGGVAQLLPAAHAAQVVTGLGAAQAQLAALLVHARAEEQAVAAVEGCVAVAG